jgi:hypothetical protein
MQRKIIMELLAGSVVLGGCVAPHSETPIATNFASQKQLKMQSASHWQLIARDAAAQLIAALPEKHPLHVRQPDAQSPFEKAFAGHLIGELHAAGYPVMKVADRPGTLQVDVSATPVLFSRDRLQGKRVGRWTALTGGLWVLREIYDDVSPGAAMMAGAVTLDAMEWFRSEFASGPTPQTELIVTASVSGAERYYARVTGAYYTTDSDWELYSGPAPALPVKEASR